MSNHLSQDQMSRCALGQANAEEEEHGHSCPQCSAELIRFKEAVSSFQSVMKGWSEEESFPRLEIERAPGAVAWRRWALAGAAIAILTAIPIYEHWKEQPIPEPDRNTDELLMEEVAAHLSRPLPMSMERVIALFPEIEQGNAPEREEVR